MRPIKFRVWDKEKKIMLYPKFDDISNLPWHGHDGKSETNRYIFQQYTGLRDRTGREIYEGDILQKLTGERIVIHPIVPVHRFYEKHCSPYGDDWMTWCDEEYEVVGNIYENPRMLREGEE